MAGLPAVSPAVTAELVGALSPRLRKRLDGGIAKLAARPVTRDGDTVRISVDDDTDLTLHAPGGTVTGVDAVRCGCLLAPDCLHRAAAVSLAPVADESAEPPATSPLPNGTAEADGPGGSGGASSPSAPGSGAATGTGAATAEGSPEAEVADPAQRDAARAVRDAVATLLEAGTDGAGAVVQAEVLRAAHTARLAGLPRAASAAVSVVTGVRAARSADPAFRLADLADGLRDVLGVAGRLPDATGAELAALRGTARQPYRPDGSLRLYGLFSEPVLTASGYAGAVTWTADADGRLYTVSDVAPGGAGRAVGAADRAVRIGDTSLTHRELSRAGLAVSGATVSPTGRLGAGAGVRAVRASGADWRGEPLDRLWGVPVGDQVSRALGAPGGPGAPVPQGGGHDLLFLDVTLVGPVRETGGDCLLADCDGVPVRLVTAHDAPGLPYRENLRLLAAAGGTRVRVVARLVPGPLPRALLLATEHPNDAAARVDLGLDRLQHADLPPSAARPAAAPAAPSPDEAPLHLLRRRVQQAVSGGRRVLAFPGGAAGDGNRLRRVGLGTAGDLLDALHAAAADRGRDVFGRLLPSDAGRFAHAWLGAAVYTAEVERALCAQAWGVDAGRVAAGAVAVGA
ncbi:hypothetical protein ACIPPJ_32650 [Streptomyces sp. NPDC086091]|uniref:hypothetical protein n=1 Tax=Streptomyces sp. NPDC086091 TaxID=3365751 RepID=UPI003801413A